MNKGQTPIITMVVASVGTIIAAVGGAWVSGAFAANSELNVINTRVSVVEERENNHYLEIGKKLDYLISKVDKIEELKTIKK